MVVTPDAGTLEKIGGHVAAGSPLVAPETPLPSGRRLFTAEVRITEKTIMRLMARAARTYALSGGTWPAAAE
jgi:hypothetical protein